jgi:hypothetical protein
MVKLPVVGRIQGGLLEARGTSGQTAVLVQYSSHTGELYELEMPFGDAMYLLNMLREMEKDSQKPPIKG